MILSDIEISSRNTLDQLDVDNSHLTPERIRLFANEGQRDLTTRVPAPLVPRLWASDIKHLSNGIDYYSMPSDWCRTVEVTLYGEFATYLPLSMYPAFSKNSFFVASTSNPYYFEPYKNNYTRILPVPTSLVYKGFERFYLRMPIDMELPTDSPELPVIYHQALVVYVVYRALLEDEDPRAGTILGEYHSLIGGKKNGSQ